MDTLNRPAVILALSVSTLLLALAMIALMAEVERLQRITRPSVVAFNRAIQEKGPYASAGASESGFQPAGDAA